MKPLPEFARLVQAASPAPVIYVPDPNAPILTPDEFVEFQGRRYATFTFFRLRMKATDWPLNIPIV